MSILLPNFICWTKENTYARVIILLLTLITGITIDDSRKLYLRGDFGDDSNQLQSVPKLLIT